MNLRMRLTSVVTLTLLTAATLPASAFPLFGGKKKPSGQEIHKPTPAQDALINKAIEKEKIVIASLKKSTPVIETYIQNMKVDPIMSASPDTDTHFLARVDFGRVINDSPYANEKRGAGASHLGFFKDSLNYISHLSSSLHLTYHASGFTQMLLIDSNSFNRQMYTFSYVRAQFAGTVPVLLFDIQPVKKNAVGRFSGRIYIDRNTGDIVRFTGSFAGGETDVSEYFHFDSYRQPIPDCDPGAPAAAGAPPAAPAGVCTKSKWMPYQVYVEETDPKSPEHTLKFKAINYIWGYQLKVPTGDAEEAHYELDNGTPTAQDMSPLSQQRMWRQQAEDNVIDRLRVAGLIDSPSDNDKQLENFANHILQENKLSLGDRVFRVRTLLTVPLETLSVGNTILISKGLLDTTAVCLPDGTCNPQTGNLLALLAFQVAHVILGHHIDTKFAFNDRLLFPSEASFQRLPMYHTDKENEAAAKKAQELLANTPEWATDGQYFSLYLQQLAERQKGLKSLMTPQMGDSLIKPDGSFWLQAFRNIGPKLNNTDLSQQGAMPLDSQLRTDPWSDQVITLNTPADKLLGASDKMPFEVHALFFQLSEYKPPVPPAAPVAAPTAPAAATPDATTAAPATAPGTDAAAPATAPAPADATAPAATAPADATAPAATTAPAADATAPAAAPDAMAPAATPTPTDTTAPATPPPADATAPATGVSNPPTDTTTTPAPTTPPPPAV